MPFPLTHPALAEALAAQGYEAYSLRGGIGAWRQAGETVR